MTREEAIERIKSRYDKWALDDKDLEAIQYIFPELKEDEDERIRKELYTFISSVQHAHLCANNKREKWLAYLEKQKEPIPIPDKFSGLKSLMLQYLQSAANRKDDAEIESDTDLYGRKILDYVWKYDENQKERGLAQFNGESLAEIIKGEFEGFRSLLKKKGIDYEPQSTYWESFARLFDSSAREYLKEQKPVECIEFDNEFKNQVSHLLASVLNKEHDYTEGFVKYVSQSLLEYAKNELKSTEWSDEYRKEDLRTRFAFYTYKNEEDDGILYLSNVFVEEASRNKGFGTKILASAEKVAETIGAITIRLKVKQNSPANAWYRKHGYGYLTFEDGYDWLEKNLEYLKPKQELSEENKTNGWTGTDLKRYLSCLQRLGTGNPQQPETINSKWFKEHCRPQHHWKPSDEQLRPLEYAIDYFKKKQNDTTYLESLYNDLKKL